MDIKKLQTTAAAAATKYFKLAHAAKTQAQIDAAIAAESVAARAAMRLDAAVRAAAVSA